jgi:DNA repair exonuclease SbcCD ATPase subunit
MVHRRRLGRAREDAEARRARLIASLSPANRTRYTGMEHMCRLIEANYQGLHGTSQAYLSEQREKLDMILNSCAHRMLALERYERLLVSRHPATVTSEIDDLEGELADTGLTERARAALRKNLELKHRLRQSLSDAEGTIKALSTELDSMASLLEVLHQNSISMRDPQAVSQELDTIVRQSEDSERVVREMESLLRSDTIGPSLPPLPDEPIVPPLPHLPQEPAAPARRKAKER